MHTDIVAAVGFVFYRKWRYSRRIQHTERRDDYLYLTCRDIGVFVATLGYCPCRLNDVLSAEAVCTLAYLGVDVLIENELCNAVPIA